MKRRGAYSTIHARGCFYDPEHSETEERFLLLGVSSAGRVLVVVHCYRKAESLVRIISEEGDEEGGASI